MTWTWIWYDCVWEYHKRAFHSKLEWKRTLWNYNLELSSAALDCAPSLSLLAWRFGHIFLVIRHVFRKSSWHRNEHTRTGSFLKLSPAFYPHPFLHVYNVASFHNCPTHFHYAIEGYETSHVWILGIQTILNVRQTVRNSRVWSFRRILWWIARHAYLKRHKACGIFEVLQETPLGIPFPHMFTTNLLLAWWALWWYHLYSVMEIFVVGFDSYRLKFHFFHKYYTWRRLRHCVKFTTLSATATPHPKPWWVWQVSHIHKVSRLHLAIVWSGRKVDKIDQLHPQSQPHA